MKIIYVSSMCSEKIYTTLFKNTKFKPGQAVMKYHRLLSQGLAENGEIEVIAISSLPINRLNCKKKVIKIKNDKEGKVDIIYCMILNIPFLKNMVVFLQAIFNIWKIAKACHTDKIIICDGLYQTISLAALLSSKIMGIKTLAVVTDIPGIMLGSGKRTKFGMWLLKQFDSYLFLTKQMNDLINKDEKPYIVQEGYVDIRMHSVTTQLGNKYEQKVCMYTGSIKKIYGIRQLTEAFIACNFSNVELHIYGEGDYSEELSELVKREKNIKFFGEQLIEVIVEAQQKADLLVNPRFTSEEYTKYSFPSKNMEYMASGTAVLTTRLPGMPQEYEKYVYFFEGEEMKDYVNTLKNVLNKSREELFLKGQVSKEFVLQEKNNVKQAGEILCMIKKEFGYGRAN